MHYFPLSLSQQNILNLERAFPGTSINNISTTVHVNGRLDYLWLQESIHRILENDDSLRTQLTTVDGELVQYHVPYDRIDFQVYDFCSTNSESIANWEIAVTREPLPLENSPLYRFVLFRDGENHGGVLVKLHHIIADGWSQISICNKIGRTYLELLTGKEVSLAPAPDYELHVLEEQRYLASKAFTRDERYWKKMLETSGEPSVLKSVTSAAISPVGRRMSFELPQLLNHAIYSFCMEKRVAPFAVFYMALAIYFKRIGGADRFTIGVPIFNRANHEFRQSTGMFVTTLPFFNEINDTWNLNQFNDILMESWYELLRHQRYPFSKIAELANTEGRLFNIALSYQDSKIYESRDTSVAFSGRWHYCGYQAEQLTIHLTNLKNHQQYAVDYDYLAQFFEEAEIERLHNNLCEILHEVLSDPERPIHRLSVLSLDQKEQLLYKFNETDRYLEEVPVYEALAHGCSDYQNRVAVICDGQRTTYGAFLYRSAGYAAALGNCGVESEDLIAILLPRKTDLLAAMVGSLQANCAYMLLSEELPPERVRKILTQSEAKVLITTEKGRRRLGACDTQILTIEEVAANGTVFYSGQVCAKDGCKDVGDKLAYVVYTSGSTGEPKGVEITQRNLLNLAQEMKDIYGQGAVLSVCNVGFDAFMLESIVALLNGRTVVLPGDEELESPDRLAALINGYAVGFFSMTPSRLSTFLQSGAFCQAMRRMESIVCGGEAFPAELLKKIKRLSNAKIYNQYGPSETTVGVSLKELSHAERITAGRPMGNCRLYVLDKWMNPMPAGGFGHLYIGGKCVGRGYRNQPELTDKYFRNNPFVADDRIYYTGDVAGWTADGEIVLRGRLDDQVKLRGLRVELQEISACIESYPGITTAVARICQLNGQQVIGAYYCAQSDIHELQVLGHLATYLPKYMIPSFLIRLEELPVNANGKVDEKRLPLPDMTPDHPTHTLSATAQSILDIFRAVLHQEDIYGNTDYFLAGGNSLNAMECIMRVEEDLGKRVRIADLYACRTAIRLAAYLSGESLDTTAAQSLPVRNALTLSKAPARKDYPLSPVQQGMYIQTMLDPSGLSYNMHGVFLLEFEPDIAALEAAFRMLIQTEPLLRTSFRQGSEGLVSHIEDAVSFRLELLNAQSLREATDIFIRPFDLQEAPLLRAALWHAPEGDWYLLMDTHHMISDGMSTPILLNRLDRAYRDGSISVQWDYYDYLHTISQQDRSQDKQQELAYWVNHLRDLPEPLNLTGDYIRPKRFDYKGADYEISLSAQESSACDAFCRQQSISGFSLFLGAYGILLGAVSGRKDLVVGAPVAGRTLPQTQNICGPFINTLPLRLRPVESLTVSKWLADVHAEVAGMLDHQQVSLEEIIQALNLPRGEQNALYQVMMTQSPVDEGAFMLGEKPMHYTPVSVSSVKMDLIVEMTQKNGIFGLRFSYATSVFADDTIRFYARCFRQILCELIKNPTATICDIKLMNQKDHNRYLESPNYAVTPFVNLPIHKLLFNRSQAIGDETAVIFHSQHITYQQLERRAAGIADFLTKQGAQPGQCIGLCLSRTPDMIAAMYAILKIGCAYVFAMPTFPEARLRYMMEIAKAPIVLYDEAAEHQMPANVFAGTAVHAYRLPDGEADAMVGINAGTDQLVNVLFTSGSTGQPKGVMLRHRSISNLYSQMKSLLDPIEGTVLCSTNSVFDCFVVETLIALALGRTVVLADEEEMMLPWKLAKLMETYHTGIMEMTPSRLQMCLGNDAFCAAAKHIRIILLGGEVVTQTLSEKFYQHTDGILMNMYGPTEATVFTTMGPVVPGKHITIGAPLQNTRTYVLDQQLRPVLPTACGELYIAGECLSAGYISRPELTESSFLEDIYFPGEKMYRSGDLVRLRLDGTFDYIGRKDAQVKLNGQRVELSEITGAMLQVSGVKQAAVVPIKKDDGSMELCAFFESSLPELNQEVILDHIRKVLPKYMTPGRFVAMESIPTTATNKIDIQALLKLATEDIPPVSVPAVSALAAPTASKKTPTEVNTDYILSVWNRVLSLPVRDVNVSFFEQGGTSMGALNVLSHYFNDSLEMSLSEFYEHPTAAGQAALLSGNHSRKCPTEISIPEVPNPSVPVAASTAVKACLNGKKVLVTGATGFFGVHLVNELISQGQQVICLLRDGSMARLEECLVWYFGQGSLLRARKLLSVVKGDISLHHLGMEEADYAALAAQIGEIYHCAADVRHYVSETDPYLSVNLGGTSNMLELAKVAKAAFYHMSTCSVSGNHLRAGGDGMEFTEADYDIGQIWEENIYVKSKFLAEGQVLKAAEDGLNVKIFRLGRLVGRAADGVFQRNPESNVFYLIVNAFRQLGVIPTRSAAEKVDLMPIDICAQQVLALKNSESWIYHIMHPNPPTLFDVMQAVAPEITTVDDDAFARILSEQTAHMSKELAALLMDHWHCSKVNPPVITVTNKLTQEHLRQAGSTQEIPGPEQILLAF